MDAQPPKRSYRNSLDFVESGFAACWRNTQDLVQASQKLMAGDLHAPALSLAVLALEELAKLGAIDGLLFARHDDLKSETFRQSLRSHAVKLSILEVFPLLLANLARSDPRYRNEDRYNLALAISIQRLKDDGNAVMAMLKDNGFHGLDGKKQQGFYVTARDQCFVSPRDTIDPSLAKAVVQMAWRAVSTLDLVLKDGNLERYISNARSIRAALTEEQHRELEQMAQKRFGEIFQCLDDGEGPIERN